MVNKNSNLVSGLIPANTTAMNVCSSNRKPDTFDGTNHAHPYRAPKAMGEKTDCTTDCLLS